MLQPEGIAPNDWRRLTKDEIAFIEAHREAIEEVMMTTLGTCVGLCWGVEGQPKGVYRVTTETGASMLVEIQNDRCYVRAVDSTRGEQGGA